MTNSNASRESKPLRRVVFEWFFAGGAILTLVATGLDYLSNEHQRDVTLHIEACKRAEEVILDDAMNAALTEGEKRGFGQQQLGTASL